MRKVLVVERDEALRRLLREVLARTAIEVDSVSEASEAVIRLAEEPYRVLVLDIEPGDRSAGAVFGAVRGLLPLNRPTVLITGEPDADALVDADAGSVVTRKPYDVTALAAAITASIAGSEPPPTAPNPQPAC